LQLEDVRGEKEDVSWGVFPLMNQDVLYVAVNGGGGYLDPLDRDPEAVLRDVRNHVVSQEAARQIYGTVIDGGLINLAATKELRGMLYAQRKDAET
jgi:N-methylhydantoinase B